MSTVSPPGRLTLMSLLVSLDLSASLPISSFAIGVLALLLSWKFFSRLAFAASAAASEILPSFFN